VFVSSHHLHEIELTCTDAAIINQGRLIVRDKVRNLLSAQETSVVIDVDDPVRAEEVLRGLEGIVSMERAEQGLRLMASGDGVADMNAALVQAGLRVSGLRRETLSLEDLYLKMMR